MIENVRKFEAGPDPFGRIWLVEFKWLQNGISIRHSDSVDVKFHISTGSSEPTEKVVALMHPHLVQLSQESGRPLSDPWCMKLAAQHLKYVIETEEDFEKTIITPSREELARYNQSLKQAAPAAR